MHPAELFGDDWVEWLAEREAASPYLRSASCPWRA